MSTNLSLQDGSLVTDDGHTLFTRSWSGDGPSQATVVLVHGYAEHCGRYDHVAECLVDAGATVCAYDQRGYGRSEGRRAYVDTFDQYLNDLGNVLEHARSRPPDGSMFLFGHSMGGLVVLKYILDHGPSVDGLLLSSPAIEINPDLAPLLRKIAQWIGWLFPTLPTSRSPQHAISRDPAVVEEANNDPLNYHGRVPARTGAEMLKAGAAVRKQLADVHLPFLVFHGTNDVLTNPDWSKRLYEEASASDKALQLYDGLYHETFNEPEQQRVLTDISNWLRARIDEPDTEVG